jgi:hypothetical protein
MQNNPLVCVRKSDIHGNGVFANQDIEAVTRIGRYQGNRTQNDGSYVLWVEDTPGGDWTGFDGINDLRFLNHARPANAEMDGLDLYSTVDISAGTEVTIDYGEWFA